MSGGATSLYQSQDSNLSAGSHHSNDGQAMMGHPAVVMDQAGQQQQQQQQSQQQQQQPKGGGGMQVDPSPEKAHPQPQARTPTERKRKRKKKESDPGSDPPDGPGSGSGGKGAKKINDYFKHTPSSPVRPPPFAGMYGPGGQQGGQYLGAPGSPYGGAGGGQGAGGGSASTPSGEFVPFQRGKSLSLCCNAAQTDLSMRDVSELENRSSAELESKDSRIEELTRVNEEMSRQMSSKQKEADEKSATITKCLNVVKELLIEKSTIERKEARAKCMQNRLRLGQFVTQRVGASFQENWTDGYAFQELAKRQEDINNEREEIERKKKLLVKRKPSEGGSAGRKRSAAAAAAAASNNGANSNASASSSASGSGVQLHNGSNNDETLFTKPPPRDGMTPQEYYEAEEILRLRLNSLKKEDAEMQLEMEKLERSRNLHIRELKRIHNEDQSRYNNHPMLNDRYLLLMLLGKGGFSEVHKVRTLLMIIPTVLYRIGSSTL